MAEENLQTGGGLSSPCERLDSKLWNGANDFH